MVQYVSTTTTHNKQPTSSNLKGSARHLEETWKALLPQLDSKQAAQGVVGQAPRGVGVTGSSGSGVTGSGGPGFETRVGLAKKRKIIKRNPV